MNEIKPVQAVRLIIPYTTIENNYENNYTYYVLVPLLITLIAQSVPYSGNLNL